MVLITRFKANIRDLKRDVYQSFPESIKAGVADRMRAVIVTTMMASIGLLPAALLHGIGSEVSKPLAIVVIGGLKQQPFTLSCYEGFEKFVPGLTPNSEFKRRGALIKIDFKSHPLHVVISKIARHFCTLVACIMPLFNTPVYS